MVNSAVLLRALFLSCKLGPGHHDSGGSMDISQGKPPLARKEGLVVKEVSGEVLLYDLDRDKAHCLNQTAALDSAALAFVRLLDGNGFRGICPRRSGALTQNSRGRGGFPQVLIVITV